MTNKDQLTPAYFVVRDDKNFRGTMYDVFERGGKFFVSTTDHQKARNIAAMLSAEEPGAVDVHYLA